jgi:hypothetical protein
MYKNNKLNVMEFQGSYLCLAVILLSILGNIFEGSFIEIYYIYERRCINVLKTGKVGISSLLFKNNLLICATRDNLLRWGY